MRAPVRLVARSQEWYEALLSDHLEEATARAQALLADTEEVDGCLVTDTEHPRKVRFLGEQDKAYRFVFCVLNRVALGSHQVVRHRCHNRLCLNPEHLLLGDRRENWHDELERRANGAGIAYL